MIVSDLQTLAVSRSLPCNVPLSGRRASNASPPDRWSG